MSDNQPDFDSNHFRCGYMAGHDQCQNLGVFKKSRDGSGPWLCNPHSVCKGRMEGALIVEQSQNAKHEVKRNYDDAKKV